MTVPRLTKGQLIKVDGHDAIVLAVGRSSCYSIVAYYKGLGVKIITEVPWWIGQGKIQPGVSKKANKDWAKQFAETHVIPDV